MILPKFMVVTCTSYKFQEPPGPIFQNSLEWLLLKIQLCTPKAKAALYTQPCMPI